MKYCAKCGAQLVDDAVICVNCGCAADAGHSAKPSGITTAAKVFMILGTIVMGLSCYLIPLIWCIPMTVVYCKKVNRGERVGTGLKVCSLLFVSLVGGILMLCDKEH